MLRLSLALWLAAAAGLQAAMMSSVTYQAGVSGYDITFTFDRPYDCGQYANGDWWVAVSTSTQRVVISQMSPAYTTGRNGWCINPSEQNRQPYDNRAGITFDASLMPALPYQARAGESVLKTASLTENMANMYIEFAAVLTVVATAPANSGKLFRPPFAGTYKPSFTTDSLQTHLLPSLAPVPGAITADVARQRVNVVRMDYSTNMGMPDVFPQEASHHWGSNMMRDDAEVFLWLCLNQGLAEKRPVLTGMVQYGIDLYGARKNLGAEWVHGGGGNGAGRMLPLVFAATMLNSGEIRTELKKAEMYDPVNAVNRTFWETAVYYRSDRTDEVYWDFTAPWDTEEGYWHAVAVLVPAGDSREGGDPYRYIDGGQGYQLCTSMPTKYHALVTHLIPQLYSGWPETTHILQEYADRWVERGVISQPDPCAPAPTLTEAEWGSRAGRGYQSTWGPDPDNPGDCLRDTDPSDGIGRFPDRPAHADGTGLNAASRSSVFGDFMWKMYRDSVPDPIGRTRPADEEKPQPGIIFYGNPFGSQMMMKVTAGPENRLIRVYNEAGRMVKTATVRRGQVKTGMENLTSGVYFYVVYDPDRPLTGKLMIAK